MRPHNLANPILFLTLLPTVKFLIRIDDSMDVFAEHGVAGMVGLFFNSMFGATYIIGLDGVNTGIITGGWLNQYYEQMYIQIAYIVAVTAYGFVVTAILCYIINYIPGLHLRASEEAELLGMDDDQLGEFAYDYVEVRRDYLAWTPANPAPSGEGHQIPMSDRHGISDHANLLNGKADSQGSSSHEKTAIVGDRHGEAAEKAMHPNLHQPEEAK